MSVSNLGRGAKPGVCTSTTRPTTPYTGQIIYETDTGYLRVWDGSAWDYFLPKQDTVPGVWQTWTPTWTGTSVGNGIIIARYTQIGKTVFAKLDYVLGSTSTMTGPLDFSPPVSAHSNYGFLAEISGDAICRDVSANAYYVLNLIVINSTTFRFTYLQQSGATNVTVGDISSTAPMTWANGDFISLQFMYEAA